MQERMIRLFVSSTFRDFEEERNRLAAEVYPELEALCRKRGFSFHVIDLRWGVSREDAAENRSARICFDEIRRCQEMSPQLNFLVMAGDRYGWRPLPVEIRAEEWERLTDGLDGDDPLRRKMESCYMQDQNSLEKTYILRTDDGLSRESDRRKLHRLLERQARERLPEEEASKYSTSATEQEIQLGYFGVEKYRENTFLMLKRKRAEKGNEAAPPEENEATPPEGKPEAKRLRRRAGKLRKRLRQSADCAGSREQVCEYEPGSSDYVEHAKRFLLRIIEKQTEACEGQSEFEQECAMLDRMYRSLEDGFLRLPWHEKVDSACRHRKGGAVFLVGASGGGKSSFLKHFAGEKEKRGKKLAAVFNDTQPGRRLLFPALEFLVDALEEQGLLKKETPAGEQIRRPVAWFERQLQKLVSGEPVTLILDSLDSISDYRGADKGLFQIKLPGCVTLIVAAKSEQALLPAEREAAALCAVPVRELSGRESMELLRAMLRKKGRCLQPWQEAAIKNSLPASMTALDVELLAQICRRLHSEKPFACTRKLTFEELVQRALFQKDRETYRVFRTHALCFLALASVGLTEAELIDLLSLDQEVVEEIRGQTEWSFAVSSLEERRDASDKASAYTGKIPVVLWAMFYAEIRELLSDVSDHGISLLQYRHVRLKESVLQAVSEEERQKAAGILCAYFSAKWQEWLLRDGNRVTPNRRKANELFPLYEQMGKYRAIQEELENLLCLDAFVRCELRQNLREYLEKYAASSRALSLLELLKEKDLLFRLWPDSFLQAALPELRLRREEPADLQEKQEWMHKAGGSHLLLLRGRSLSKDGAFFPQLKAGSQFAVNDRRMVAVWHSGILRVIDMNQRIFTETACFTTEEPCFLYWKDDGLLVVRCAGKRLFYRFCGAQLTGCGQEACPDWGKLLSDEKVSGSGGAAEAEAFCTTAWQESVRYFEDGEPVRTLLFYPDQTEVYVRTRGSLAAVITGNGTGLEVVDLKCRKVLLRKQFSVITGLEWSPSGRTLLVILRENTLECLEVRAGIFADEMSGPEGGYKQYRKKMLENGLKDMERTFYEISAAEAGAVSAGNRFARQMPLFGALSVRYGWFACYYHKNGSGELQLYSLEGRPYWKRASETDAIRVQNSGAIPLYLACDRNGLVLDTGRRIKLLDIGQKQWMKAPASSLRPKETEPELVSSYLRYVGDRLNLNLRPVPETDPPQGLFRRLFHGKGRPAADPVPRFLRFLECGRVRWLVDGYHGLVLAYGPDDACIYHDMIMDRILAADVSGGRLYLLTERADQILEMELIETTGGKDHVQSDQK